MTALAQALPTALTPKTTRFGLWLLQQINLRGWSSSDLAVNAGISKTTVSHLINGKVEGRNAQTSTLVAIARALSLPLATVLEHCDIDLGVAYESPALAHVVDMHLVGIIRSFAALSQPERHLLLQALAEMPKA